MTQRDYYELHVTLTEPAPDHPGWHPSAIDGDPVLGDGVKHYKTAATKTEKEARKWIADAKLLWPQAIRYKIEHVIYDERYERKNLYS